MNLAAAVRRIRLRFGIDVSSHQGDIDWQKVVQVVSFAWVKSTEGEDFVDPRFTRQRVHAIRTARGPNDRRLKWGPYHFLRPRHDRNGAVEARHAVRVAKDAGWKPSRRWVWGRRDFPLCVDVEVGFARQATMRAADHEVDRDLPPSLLVTGNALFEYVSDFCDEVKRLTGRGCVVYCSPGFAEQFGGRRPRNGAVLWVAAWDAPDGRPPVPRGWGRRHVRFHQISDSGTCPGVHGPVDTNVFIQLGGGTPAPDPDMGKQEINAALRRIGWPLEQRWTPKTIEATKMFQRGYARGRRLVVDGVVGPKTGAAIRWSLAHDGHCSQHFKFREFASASSAQCPGNGWIWVYRALPLALEKYRRRVGHAVGVLNGCRDPRKNKCVGGVSQSQHLFGGAMDPRRAELGPQAVAALGVFSGIGFDRRTGLVRHMDVRHVTGHNPGGNTPSNPAVFPE